LTALAIGDTQKVMLPCLNLTLQLARFPFSG
jgi:hypothetical protein